MTFNKAWGWKEEALCGLPACLLRDIVEEGFRNEIRHCCHPKEELVAAEVGMLFSSRWGGLGEEQIPLRDSAGISFM